MKTIYKRALSLVMIFAMAIGIIPMSAIALYAADDAEYPALVLDEEVVISTDEYEGGKATFSFVPTETASYTFYSYNNDFDTTGHLYDSEWNFIKENGYARDDNGNFTVSCKLTAGETYYFESEPYYSYPSASGSYTVKLIKTPVATSITIENVDSLSGHVGDYRHLYISFTPFNAYEKVEWTSDNTSVVTVDEDGGLEFVGVGTATVTVMSERGLSDSITVTVKAVPAILLDEEVVISTDGYEGGVAEFSFVPTETASYTFYSYNNDFETHGCLYDSKWNRIGVNTNYYNGNFIISYKLTAGETYYFSSEPYYNYVSGAYTVKLIKTPAATSITIDNGDSLFGYVGDYTWLHVSFAPEGCADEEVEWMSDNTSVVTVEGDGYHGQLGFVAVGTAIVTATSERGLSDSITVTVKAVPAILLDEEVVISTDEYYNGAAKFSFTPTETAYYSFYSYNNDFEINGNVSDSEENWFVEDDYSGDGNGNFRIICKLTAGETYYFSSGPYDDDVSGAYTVKLVKTPAATSITIDEGDSLSGYVGGSDRLDCLFDPEDAYEKVEWTSDNTSVVTVDEDGDLEFVGVGTATVTVTSENELTDSIVITVTVIERPAATSITIDKGDSLSGYVGDYRRLWIEFDPEGAYEEVTWESDNTSVVTVDADGDLKFVGVGTATVTATSERGLTDSIFITVTQRPTATSITIGEGESLSGYVGDYAWLHVSFDPEGAYEEVTWESDNTSVVTVDWYGNLEDGNLEFVGVGTATVTVTSGRGLTDSITVTVKAIPALVLDEEVVVSTDEYEGGVAKFSFVPTETAYYNFHLYNNDFEIRGDVYDSEWSSIETYDRRYDYNGNFTVICKLTAGETYYFYSGLDYGVSAASGAYTVKLTKLPNATSITINAGNSLSGWVGESKRLYTSVTPEGAVAEVEWTSDNTSVVTVSEYGTLEFVGAGTATVTVTSESGLTDSIFITVTQRPTATSITINRGDSLSGYVGDSTWLGVSFDPEGAYEELEWTSDNTSVVTVDEDGYLEFIGVGTATVTVTSENELTDSITVTVKAIPPLVLGEEVVVSIDDIEDFAKFSFVPEVTGEYIFYLSGNDGYLYGRVYDSEMNRLDYEYDYNYESFRISCNLTAGETYYFRSEASANYTSEYTAVLQKAVPATSISFDIGSEYSGYIGEYHYIYVIYDPFYSGMEYFTWVSSDPDVVDIADYNNECRIYLKAVGTATITAASESGLTFTCTITVKDYEAIEIDEEIVISTDEYYGGVAIFSFVPDETATYNFYVYSEEDVIECILYDSEMNEIASRYISRGAISYELTAGEKYYFVSIPMNYIDPSTYVPYTVELTKVPNATSITIDEGDSLSGYVGDYAWLYVSFDPEDAYEEVTWESDNTSVVTVSEYGKLEFVGIGTATVTVRSESGLEDSITITVKAIPEIELGSEVTVEINNEGEEARYYFTPTETDIYNFTVIGDEYYYIEVYEADTNERVFYASGYNINRSVELTANTTYYIHVGYDYYSGTGSFALSVTKAPDATSITIYEGESLSGYVGDYTWLDVSFDPEGCVYEEVTWESDNTSVVTVSKYGKLEFVGAGTATVTVRSENELTDSITITVKAIPTLVLGEEVVGHADSDSDGTFEKFSFVPDVTGEYVFYSYNTDFYISVYLYDSEGYRLASDYADNGNFRISCTLTAGETYYFSIEAPDGTPNGDEYTVVLQKAVPATSISLAVGSEYSGYIGEYHYIDVVFDPVYSIMESVEWISSDPDVVCIDDYDNGWCRIYLKAVGTATITATSESDLTFTCTITVKDYETIELDEEKNVVLSGNAMYYYFTPDEDGYYSFYSYNGDCDPYGLILDSDMNEIASNDDGAKDYNFNAKCYLQAGVKYILVSRTYGGAEGSFSVSVKKTKVITDLEIVSMPDKTEYVKGFRPEELSFDGLELKVTWSDGSITYWEYDGELYIDDEEIDGDVEEFEDSIVFTLMCGEGSVDITITLVESPVSSIAVTKLPDRLEFIRGYDPDFIGLELTITYKDGTTKVVTLTEENLAYEVDIDEGVIYYTVDVDGNTLIIYKSGYDCYSAYYLGAECEIRDITFTQSKEIESVELDNVSWNGHGMIVKITYTDGTSETLTMDVVDYEFVMGGGSDLGVAVCAKTENGLLWCGIITYIDENGNVEGYDVYILDGVITVDASDLLIGDVNGDGSVDNLDRLVLTRYLADWEGYSAADINMAAADVNNDLSVDNLDRLILTRHLANWEGYEELPID